MNQKNNIVDGVLLLAIAGVLFVFWMLRTLLGVFGDLIY